MIKFYTILLLTVLTGNLLHAQDDSISLLKQVSMPLAVEPIYNGTPRYALLIVGEDLSAKHWLVVDDANLYIDKNCNRDLTDEGETIPLDTGPVTSGANPEFRMQLYRIGILSGYDFNLWVWRENSDHQPAPDEKPIQMKWRAERVKNGFVCATLYRNPPSVRPQQIFMVLCENAEDSQITHIGGDLTLACNLGTYDTTLLRGADNTLRVHVGTLGVRAKHSRFESFSRLSLAELPKDFHPTATMRFANAKDDAKKIVVKIELENREVGGGFTAPISIPKNAKDGLVQIEFQFPDWENRRVIPRNVTMVLKSSIPDKK